MKFLSLFLACAIATAGVAQDVINRCGTRDPPAALQIEYAEAEKRWSAKVQPRTYSRTINTYVHVVTTEKSKTNWTQAQVNEQINIMTRAYRIHGFSFRLVNTSYTVNDAWSRLTTDEDETAMKTALRKGSYRDLNLYFLSNLGGGLLGFCYFPVEKPTAEDILYDGCVNLAGSLPNGGTNNYQLGATAVHEVGHWFGLFHVFQGSNCTGQGDFVIDTPRQKNATRGCPRDNVPDSCPDSPGKDSIFNWMDYSYDECMDRFSIGQGIRMRSIFRQTRDGK